MNFRTRVRYAAVVGTWHDPDLGRPIAASLSGAPSRSASTWPPSRRWPPASSHTSAPSGTVGPWDGPTRACAVPAPAAPVNRAGWSFNDPPRVTGQGWAWPRWSRQSSRFDPELPVRLVGVGIRYDLDVDRPIAAPLERCAQLLGVDLATIRKLATQVEPYLRADGTRIWSLMQLEGQLWPEAYGRRRGGYLDRRRTPAADAEPTEVGWLTTLTGRPRPPHTGRRSVGCRCRTWHSPPPACCQSGPRWSGSGTAGW